MINPTMKSERVPFPGARSQEGAKTPFCHAMAQV